MNPVGLSLAIFSMSQIIEELNVTTAKSQSSSSGGQTEKSEATTQRVQLNQKLNDYIQSCLLEPSSKRRWSKKLRDGEKATDEEIASFSGHGFKPEVASTSSNLSRWIFGKINTWTGLYRPLGAVAMSLFGKQSVWRAQVEVLSHPIQLGRYERRSRRNPGSDPGGNPGGNPGGPNGNGNGAARDPQWLPGDDGFLDQAAKEFKEIVQNESNRVSVAGAMIASVIITALGLDFLSQSHWSARALWISSLVTALLATYYAGDLIWKIGRLFSGRQVRAWIRRTDVTMIQVLQDDSLMNRTNLRDMICPALPSVLTVSAPGVLLAASLLFLLLGFGVYLGFIWTRILDTEAGHDDSRDVFIVYIVVLSLCYVIYSAADFGQDIQSGMSVSGALAACTEKLKEEWPRYILEQEQEFWEKEAKRLELRHRMNSLKM
ncbi:hypothetical protein EJ04DRAFT_571493 [Polyplosphaeria fusca]|uniref:Uncharacterized protein n=1 Tax=Polyplosphaeria fusca TaxID=682080 RepID=A0A9P4V985_9PLEO|nr:hypothetical protein EJ04DRAFT_571493 [Polyplosphaeria fusca]